MPISVVSIRNGAERYFIVITISDLEMFFVANTGALEGSRVCVGEMDVVGSVDTEGISVGFRETVGAEVVGDGDGFGEMLGEEVGLLMVGMGLGPPGGSLDE